MTLAHAGCRAINLPIAIATMGALLADKPNYSRPRGDALPASHGQIDAVCARCCVKLTLATNAIISMIILWHEWPAHDFMACGYNGGTTHTLYTFLHNGCIITVLINMLL